jgi:hypothetical protein
MTKDVHLPSLQVREKKHADVSQMVLGGKAL